MMSETQTINSPVLNLMDESYDSKKSNTCHLSLLASECPGPKGENQNSFPLSVIGGFAYAVLDTNTNKYIALYTAPALPQGKGEIESFAPLQGLGATSFKSVTCAVAHPKFTLIPSALFDEENKVSLLGFNHQVDSEEKIHSDTLHNLEAKNIFTISKSFESVIRKHFVNVHFIHNATSFIEGLLIQNKNNTGKKAFANFHSSYFEIAILDNRELLFSNAFKYKTSEDIAYYILFIYEQLHLNPEEVALVLSGEIEKTAKEHGLLYHYIRHVKFASLPDGFRYSYKFDEIPNHKFFSLFTQYLVTN